jgi:hypothetical protein
MSPVFAPVNFLFSPVSHLLIVPMTAAILPVRSRGRRPSRRMPLPSPLGTEFHDVKMPACVRNGATAAAPPMTVRLYVRIGINRNRSGLANGSAERRGGIGTGAGEDYRASLSGNRHIAQRR